MEPAADSASVMVAGSVLTPSAPGLENKSNKKEATTVVRHLFGVHLKMTYNGFCLSEFF